ncbi:MAG: hypothetical protein KDC67_07955 [Ignavibacteriae bacterium]|nr:hypothetical protein [Ignavibacteriota bacterium]MCB0747504.1 hypothetical protein [Ignavibacteriota bacterium]
MKRNINIFFYTVLLTAAIFSIFYLSSCEDGPTEPEIEPGRRDYTWKVDTLLAWSTYLLKMWGSSTTDVWAVGHGSTFDKTIWHYDGAKWITDGVSKGIDPWCIYGFAHNDVWIGGADGKIWHFNGNKWSENLFYKEDVNYIYHDIIFMDIWGEQPNDIFAVGMIDSVSSANEEFVFAIIMHYDGNKWNKVDISYTKGQLKKIRKDNYANSNYFINNFIVSLTNPDSAQYFSLSGNTINEISHVENITQDLTVINSELIFSFDRSMYIYKNNKFNLIATNPFENAWNALYGRNRKDLIWMMSDGLTHYNGTDFKYILNTNNKSWSDGVVFENEVFFLANDFYNDNTNNIVYHGQLK